MQKCVITGGPSIGKTTVIEILASRGHAIVPEAARIIIEEEKIKNSDVLPWKDRAKFQHAVFVKQVELESRATGERVFIDRGLLDLLGYCRYYAIPVPEGFDAAVQQPYDKVFLLEPLGLYEEDGLRNENLQIAQEVHKAVQRAYEDYGYNIIHVPVLPPEERADYILARV